MLYNISDDYIFDSENLTIYKSNNRINVMKEEKFKFKDKYFKDKYIKNSSSIINRCVNSAGVVPTFNCNLRCVYCSQSSTEGKKDLDFKDFKIFLEEIIRKRLIYSVVNKEPPSLELYFTGGGEPTYNWLLFYNCVEYAKKACEINNICLKLHITTNAYFNEDKLKYLCENFYSVMISYDGNDEINIKNRFRHKSIDVQNNIKYNIYNLSKSTDVTIRTTVLPSDFKSMATIASNIIKEFPDIINIDFNPVFPAGRALKLKCSDEDNYNLFLRNFIELSKNNKSNRIKVTTPIFSVDPIEFGCGGVANIASEYWLFPDSKIRTCVDSYGSSVIIGKINEGMLEYEDLSTDIFREDIKKNSLKCQKCIAFPVCGFGCPLKRIRDFQNGTNYMEKECELQRDYWKYVLNQLVERGSCRGWIAESAYNREDFLSLKYIGE